MSIKKTYGLIGKNIDYSFSVKYFGQKFNDEKIIDSEYVNFDLREIEDFNNLEILKINGLNVTIPYKEKIITYLDEVDKAARIIGAVNTIAKKDNKLIGYNTDYIGFIESFKNNLNFKNALILGTGGASKAIQYALNIKNINFDIASRKNNKKYISYDLINEKIKDYDLIINTTPLGTFPDVSKKPKINYNLINENHFCYDLIYNPEKTSFLKECERKGARIMNGLEMLKSQAEESWIIWNSVS
jgi:shikimate dehydrogenase